MLSIFVNFKFPQNFFARFWKSWILPSSVPKLGANLTAVTAVPIPHSPEKMFNYRYGEKWTIKPGEAGWKERSQLVRVEPYLLLLHKTAQIRVCT